NREFADLQPGGRDFTIDKTRMFVEQNLVPMPFHPGAERYWRGKGVPRWQSALTPRGRGGGAARTTRSPAPRTGPAQRARLAANGARASGTTPPGGSRAPLPGARAP